MFKRKTDTYKTFFLDKAKSSWETCLYQAANSSSGTQSPRAHMGLQVLLSGLNAWSLGHQDLFRLHCLDIKISSENLEN